MKYDRNLKEWVYDISDPKEWNLSITEWIGSREYAVDLLSKSKGWEQCNDGEFTYYATVVNGHRLMYRRTSNRTDGRKMYRLTDELASLLQFSDIYEMQCVFNSIQYWRGWVSTERLKKALERYEKKMKRPLKLTEKASIEREINGVRNANQRL